METPFSAAADRQITSTWQMKHASLSRSQDRDTETKRRPRLSAFWKGRRTPFIKTHVVPTTHSREQRPSSTSAKRLCALCDLISIKGSWPLGS